MAHIYKALKKALKKDLANVRKRKPKTVRKTKAKPKSRYLTSAMLREQFACDYAVRQFTRRFGKRVRVTVPMAVRHAKTFGSNVGWLMEHTLRHNPAPHDNDVDLSKCRGCQFDNLPATVKLARWAKRFIAEGKS